jgi:hypothetical protein
MFVLLFEGVVLLVVLFVVFWVTLFVTLVWVVFVRFTVLFGVTGGQRLV